MFTLWLIVAIALFAISAYCIGRFVLNDPVGSLWLCFIGSLVWPLVLAASVLAGPFIGLFWLGDRKREKLKNQEK